MPHTIGSAFRTTLRSYIPEDTKLQAPVLSFYAFDDGSSYLSLEYITEEQKALVRDYFDMVSPPLRRELIEQFQRSVPHAKIVEILNSHHCCFIKNEELVYDEMNQFLSPDEKSA